MGIEIYQWNDNRRFHSYLSDLKIVFGKRVQKLAVDAGFTCPNRDGSKGFNGCTFCLNDAFNPSYCRNFKSITQQLEEGVKFHKWRYRRADSYLAYFQSFSNTYADVNYLEKVYNEALNYPGVVGIVIGTRPDCIDDEKLQLLKDINKKKYVFVEYGVESCYDDTLQRINRCHNYKTSVDAIIKTSKAGIKTGAHLILGLPGDNKERIINMAKIISKLPLNSIKLHQLQIFIGTKMEEQFQKDASFVKLYSLDEYIEIVTNFVENLKPSIAIERISGEAPPRYLANKGWGLIRSDEVLRRFEQSLENKNTFQGKYYNE